MAQLPKKGELTKIARELGYTLETKTGGRHASKFVNDETGHKIPVPAHKKDLKKGTVQSILKAMGYNEVRDNVRIYLNLGKNILVTGAHIAKAKKDKFDIYAEKIELKESGASQQVLLTVRAWKKVVKNAYREKKSIPKLADYKEQHQKEQPKKPFKRGPNFNL